MQASETPPDQEAARDILAAEAFAVPAPDPALRREPLVLPEDPSGIAEPHDILAAEEFAMPAVAPHQGTGSGLGPRARRRLAIGGLATAVVGLLSLRRRRA